MNTPYVKQYDDNGNVSNPIEGTYLSKFKNRHERRKKMKEFPHIKQFVNCRDKQGGELTGEVRMIKHYI